MFELSTHFVRYFTFVGSGSLGGVQGSGQHFCDLPQPTEECLILQKHSFISC